MPTMKQGCFSIPLQKNKSPPNGIFFFQYYIQIYIFHLNIRITVECLKNQTGHLFILYKQRIPAASANTGVKYSVCFSSYLQSGSNPVNSILSNEKYKSDALLQKKFTVDFLKKKMKTNEGEVPQYYVERSHEVIRKKFLTAYNQLMTNRESVISACLLMRQVLSDYATLNTEIDRMNDKITVVAELVKACFKEKAASAQSQEEYKRKYNGLLARYEKAATRLMELTAEKERKRNQDREIKLFIETLKKQPLILDEWDERLWILNLDRATAE